MKSLLRGLCSITAELPKPADEGLLRVTSTLVTAADDNASYGRLALQASTLWS